MVLAYFLKIGFLYFFYRIPYCHNEKYPIFEPWVLVIAHYHFHFSINSITKMPYPPFVNHHSYFMVCHYHKINAKKYGNNYTILILFFCIIFLSYIKISYYQAFLPFFIIIDYHHITTFFLEPSVQNYGNKCKFYSKMEYFKYF